MPFSDEIRTQLAPEGVLFDLNNSKKFLGVKRSTRLTNGGSDLQVIELPDAIKTVLVRWNRAKIDLTELARLRWIEKMTLSKICQKVGMARSAVQVSTRTIRNCGISGLNLSDSEKKLIEIEMNREIEKFEREQPNFRKSKAARDSRKVLP